MARRPNVNAKRADHSGYNSPNFTPILSFSPKKPINKEIILTIKTANASRKRTFLAIFKKRFAQDLHNKIKISRFENQKKRDKPY
jgi:hypothetical protein